MHSRILMGGLLLSFVLVLGICTGTVAADWPQFQGPNRDGTSPETGFPREWPADGPKVLWTTKVGPGYGGPAVVDGEVFFLDRVEEARDVLRCLDLNSGEEKWRHAYDAPGSTGHSGSRTTPTVEGKYVYTVGLMGDFVCFDREKKAVVWRKNLFTDYGVEIPSWGASQSPSIYKNLVIAAPQAPDAFVVAYDKLSGEEVWRSAGLGDVGYSTPVVTTLCGVDQAVMMGAGADAATAGISLEDGGVLWRYGGWKCRIPIPYPTTLPGDRLFITGGYGAGSAMIQIKKDGSGAFSVEELFTLDAEECGSQIHQPLFYKDHLYANSNSNEREDGMTCISLDGKVLWQSDDGDRLPTFERGSLILADGMIITLHGKRGTLHLVDPSPEGYKEFTSARVLRDQRMWSPMALSEGKLLVRGQEEMKCLDLMHP